MWRRMSHVKHMHASSLLVQPNFSSKLMITQTYFWSAFKLIENSLLVIYMLHVTHSPSHTLLDQKLDPPVLLRRRIFGINYLTMKLNDLKKLQNHKCFSKRYKKYYDFSRWMLKLLYKLYSLLRRFWTVSNENSRCSLKLRQTF